MLGITRSSTGFISHLALAGIGWRVAEGEERGSGIRRWRVRAKEDWKEQGQRIHQGVVVRGRYGTVCAGRRCSRLGTAAMGRDWLPGGVEPGMTGGVNGGLLQDAETEHRTQNSTGHDSTGRYRQNNREMDRWWGWGGSVMG